MAHEGAVSGPVGAFLSPAAGTGASPSNGVEGLHQLLVLALDVDDSVLAMRLRQRG